MDEKGRLKVPVNFQQYLISLGGARVFITSLDGATARIYPLPVWMNNLKLLGEQTEAPEDAEDLVFMANDWGAESDIDNQGRVLFPTNLRRELKLESAAVWLECYNDAITAYGEAEYERRKQRARADLDKKLSAFKKKGLR